MKKGIFTIIVLSLFLTGNLFAQYVTAYDDAGNYTSWETGNNNGFGFSAWDMWITGNAGFFIGSSSTQGFGDIDVDGKSFGMYGNTTLGDYSNAQRLFSNWSDGATFTIDLATAYRNGNKGIDIWATDFEKIFTFNVGGDKYTAGGVDQTTWDYSQTSIFHLSATQNGNDVDILITRGTDSYSNTITGKSLIGFKLYEGNTESGDFNNLFFNNLKVSYIDPTKVPATANVTIEGDVILGATQTLTLNNLSIPTGNSITLESTSSGTGSLIIKGTCTDEINVQRFLTGGWDWHFLSSPVVDQPIVGGANFIWFMEGVGGDPNTDFFRYDETETGPNPWINIKAEDGSLNTNFGNPSGAPLFEEGMGYLVAYNALVDPKTFTGVPNSGIVGSSLTYTADGSKGWNLVGNPYPCAADWEFGSNTKINLASAFYYVYNQDLNGGGGGFEYFATSVNSGANSDNVNGKIPEGQGFLVKVAEGGGLFAFSPFARTHDAQPFLKNEREFNNLLKLNIQGAEYSSLAKILITDDGLPGADYNDAFMLFSLNSTVPQLYSVDGTEKLVMNSVPFPAEDYSIPMGLKTGEAGTYTITAEDIENFNSSVLPILEDTETGLEIDLRFEGSYTFEVVEPGINNSRFILHLKTAVGVDELAAKTRIAVSVVNHELRIYNLEAGSYQVRVMDIMGRVLLNEIFENQQTISIPARMDAGTYIVQISNASKQWVEKVVIH